MGHDRARDCCGDGANVVTGSLPSPVGSDSSPLMTLGFTAPFCSTRVGSIHAQSPCCLTRTGLAQISVVTWPSGCFQYRAVSVAAPSSSTGAFGEPAWGDVMGAGSAEAAGVMVATRRGVISSQAATPFKKRFRPWEADRGVEEFCTKAPIYEKDHLEHGI